MIVGEGGHGRTRFKIQRRHLTAARTVVALDVCRRPGQERSRRSKRGERSENRPISPKAMINRARLTSDRHHCLAVRHPSWLLLLHCGGAQPDNSSLALQQKSRRLDNGLSAGRMIGSIRSPRCTRFMHAAVLVLCSHSEPVREPDSLRLHGDCKFIRTSAMTENSQLVGSIYSNDKC